MRSRAEAPSFPPIFLPREGCRFPLFPEGTAGPILIARNFPGGEVKGSARDDRAFPEGIGAGSRGKIPIELHAG